jgi:3D (Asp-Asp-Asp) domain-containing protein
VRTRSRSDAALLAAVLTGSLLAVAVPVALGADSPRVPAQTAPLRAATTSIDAQTRAATLELYALETRLARARETLAGIVSRRAAVERERAAIDRRIAVAQAALRVSERRLGELLRALYQQGGTTDPLEVVLGAGSIDEAMAGLDGLDRAAVQSAEIIKQTRAARLRLGAARARLASRAAELAEIGAAADAEASELAGAANEREAYLAELRRRQELNAARIGAVQAQAREAGVRALAASPPARSDATADATAAPVRAVPAGGTLTVTSTGYVLRGRTSSGVPTAPGVVAVDPSVIPLGTRMTVPGYGEAVAADTGSSVIGNTIDLWFPTLEQAHAWGRRTVTITLR